MSMEDLELEEIQDIQMIQGVPFPAFVAKTKLVISGPPGSGKTTIIKALGGWPEEGYLDISSGEWWKSPIIQKLPRELHFGLPFIGHDEVAPVYNTEAINDRSYLELDLFRIPLPPPKTHPLSPNFRGRYIFEFILLPPEKIFALRKKRAETGTHHVDKNLQLSDVQEQVSYYRDLALYFHNSGMTTYIRDDFDATPKRIKTSKLGKGGAVQRDGTKQEKQIYEQVDQLKLRQQILNRSWNLRGNKELLDFFTQILPRALDSELCSIFIHDKATDKVWLQSSTDQPEGRIEVPTKGCIVGDVITSGQYRLVTGLDKKEGPHKQVDSKTGFVTRNILSVPILSLDGKNVMGAINLLNKKNADTFSTEDRNTLEKLAYHLEIAIENIHFRREMMNFSELMSHQMDKSKTYFYMWVGSLLLVILLLLGFIAVILPPDFQADWANAQAMKTFWRHPLFW